MTRQTTLARSPNDKSRMMRTSCGLNLVPRRGLEPPRSYPLVPETSASTNSATWAGTFLTWLRCRYPVENVNIAFFCACRPACKRPSAMSALCNTDFWWKGAVVTLAHGVRCTRVPHAVPGFCFSVFAWREQCVACRDGPNAQ